MVDSEKIRNLDHRIFKLTDYLTQYPPDTKKFLIAQSLLQSLREKKYQLSRSDLPFPEITSVKHSTSMTEEELYEKLGFVYLIFGPSYEETFSYHTYRIEFLYTKTNPAYYCLMTVVADIYEDDELLMHLAHLDFWKSGLNQEDVTDVTISYWDNSVPLKYPHHFHWFDKLAFSLASIWNTYHIETPKLGDVKGGNSSATISEKS